MNLLKDHWPLIVEAGHFGSRLVAARAISILAFPVVAALYGPAAFGQFAAYTAIVNILWVAMFARLELAIVPARSDAEARSIAAVALLIGSASTIVAALLAAIAISWSAAWMGLSSAMLMLLPASLGMRGLFRLAVANATRRGDLTAPARATVMQAITQLVIQVGLAWSPLDLFVSLAIGDAVATAIAALVTLRAASDLQALLLLRQWPTVASMRSAASHWLHLPAFGLPGSIVIVITINLPFILLPMWGDADMAGRFALALRLLDVPGQLIASTATPILEHRMSRVAGERRAALLLVGIGLCAVAALLCMISLIVFAVILAPWISSSRWGGVEDALLYALPFALGVTAGGPLANLSAVVRADRATLPIHLILLGAMLVAALGIRALNILVLVFGAATVVRTIFLLIILVGRSKRAGDSEVVTS